MQMQKLAYSYLLVRYLDALIAWNYNLDADSVTENRVLRQADSSSTTTLQSCTSYRVMETKSNYWAAPPAANH